MNKKELVAAIAKKMDVTKVQAEKNLEDVIGVIKDSVISGERISLVGFGVFDSVETPERTCRNPQTGEEILVPAHRTPKFKYSKAVKDAVKDVK